MGQRSESNFEIQEAKLSLNLRRREANEDKGEEGEGGDRREELSRSIEDSDGESKGAAAEYEEELNEKEEEHGLDEKYVEEEIEEEMVQYEERGGEAVVEERAESGKV